SLDLSFWVEAVLFLAKSPRNIGFGLFVCWIIEDRSGVIVFHKLARLTNSFQVEKRSLVSNSSGLDRKSTRLNSSHVSISYAGLLRQLHSFPTRRSSDSTASI